MGVHFAVMALLLLPGVGQAPPGLESAGILERLSNLELSAGDTFLVRDLTLRRDVLSVSFRRGVLAFLEPVDGRVTGAVFVGSGDALAIPPDDTERRQMNRFTGSPILNERFDAAILRFTDETYREVLDSVRSRAQEDIRADDLEALLPWGENLGETSRLLNFRLLQDLAGPSERPLFFAALRGESLGWFDVAYDARRAEEIVIASRSQGRNGVPSVWASFNRRPESSDPTLYGVEEDSDFDVRSYRIDTTISAAGGLEAVAEASFVMRRAGEQVLEFHLTPSLRLSGVRFEGAPLPFFQRSDGGPTRPGSSERFVVVLPRPPVEGELLRLEFDYSGRVLERRGNGVYYVSERVAWYPRGGGLDPAVYDLTFHYPGNNVLVATGRLVEESRSAGVGHSRWSSDEEFVVSGFNYGDFSIESDETSSPPIYVHVNNDVETVFEELSAERAASTESVLGALSRLWGRRRPPAPPVPVLPDFGLFSTRRLAANVVGQVRSIVEAFSERLGEYPFDRLSVAQFPVAFSQGWPSLLYVSTLTFFDAEQRSLLRLPASDGDLDAEYVLAHEIAHQWFGNTVSWKSYRDQWVSEGFSNYMALLYLEQSHGEARAGEILAELADRLLARSGSGRSYDDNGPVWLGRRLATADVPDGYENAVYPKATWIVHMLRTLMRDAADGSDEGFFRMVREYLGEFAGGPATTWDLKSVAERHMTPRMDLEGDGTLDWFFDQWVFSTGVPDYSLEYEVAPEPASFRVRGRIRDRQGLDFLVPLPLVARLVTGEVRELGDVVVREGAATFEFTLAERPVEILMDPDRSVLRR